MKVLAGDIGGTKTWLRVTEFGVAGPRVLAEQRYESAAYAHVSPMLSEFLAGMGSPRIDKACFGVAGPVRGDSARQTVQVTHLPWQIDSRTLAGEFAIPRVRLMNDFQATGYGIEALAESDMHILHAGIPLQHAPRLVIGAGTGFGMAQLIWQHDHYEVLPSESGHADFAPRDELQIDLLHYLMQRDGRAFYDQVVSGPGLVNIYDFLCRRQPAAASPALRQAMQDGDAAAAITEYAARVQDRLAGEALDLFVTLYGAWAGSLALITQPRGGVYVAGGIAPRIIEWLRAGGFMRAFLDKGVMTPVVEAMPVQVVLNTQVGLTGAALAGSRL
ncbi:MAG: glucokinase [Proteobacteria bacterium]|nr:glucokinase [Pseudomonadota bacterium]